MTVGVFDHPKILMFNLMSFLPCIVRLRGFNTTNGTEMFTGFVISSKNEFADEESGYFVPPFSSGVSKMECKDGTTSQLVSSPGNTLIFVSMTY